jgi:chromosome partitioning protein
VSARTLAGAVQVGPRQHPFVICLYINKGGVGKTTAAVDLAWLFGAAGWKTLCIDANAKQPSATTIYKHLKVEAPFDLATEDHPEVLDRVKRLPYEVIIIDCPPSEKEAGAALGEADMVIVPFSPKPLETQALMHTIRHILSGKPYWVLFSIIPYRMRGRHTANNPYSHKSQVGRTREALTGQGVPMFDVLIRDYSIHDASVSTGYPIFTERAQEDDPSAKNAAADYRALFTEVQAVMAAQKGAGQWPRLT